MNDPLDEPRLLAEFLAAPGLTSRHLARLSEAGVTTAAWMRAGGLTTPRVSTAGRLFTPDPVGKPMFMMRVFDGEPVSFENPDDGVRLADLLAFRLDDPSSWWLRRGSPDLVLGKGQLAEALSTGAPICLHETPLAWLRAECRVACLLDLAEAWQASTLYWQVAA